MNTTIVNIFNTITVLVTLITLTIRNPHGVIIQIWKELFWVLLPGIVLGLLVSWVTSLPFDHAWPIIVQVFLGSYLSRYVQVLCMLREDIWVVH